VDNTLAAVNHALSTLRDIRDLVELDDELRADVLESIHLLEVAQLVLL